MNRITSMDIESIGNHRNTCIDLAEGNLNLFTAEEGAGKSFILNSPDLAITGRCRLTDIDGDHVTNDLLWDAIGKSDRDPATETPKVTLGLVSKGGVKGILTRTRKTWSLKIEDGTSINTKDGLAAFLGVRTLKVAEAALRSQHLLEMTSEEKVKLLFEALAKPLTVEELAEHDIDDKQVQQRVINFSVSSGRAMAAEKKRQANTAAAAVEVALAPEEKVETLKGVLLVKDIPKSKVEGQIAKIQEEKDELQKLRGRAEAIADLKGDVTLVKEAVADAEKAQKVHGKAQAELKAFLESVEAKAAAEWKEAKARLSKEYSDIQQGLMVTRSRIPALEAAVKAAQEKLALVEGQKGDDFACPWCARSTPTEKAIEKLKQEVKAAEEALEQVRAAVRMDESGLASTKKEGAAVVARLAGYEEKVTKLKEAETAAREEAEAAVRHATLSQEKAEQARIALEEAKKDCLSKEEIDAKYDALLARLQNSQRILSAIAAREDNIRRHKEGLEKAKVHREEAKRYEAMEAALSDSGFLAQRVQEPLALLRAKVDQVAALMFRDDLKLVVADDLRVTMRGRTWELGSKGQRKLMGIVMAAAIVSLSGFGILVVDDLDNVGAKSRDKVMGGLAALCKARELEQVFCAVVRGRDGWCDACGSMTVADSKGGCVLVRGDAKCGTKVGLSRPRGPMVGVLRSFEVDAGIVTEVTPLGQAVTA